VDRTADNLANGPHIADDAGYKVTQSSVYWFYTELNPLEVYRSACGIVVLNANWRQSGRQDVQVFRDGNKSQKSPLKKKFTTMSENTLSQDFESEGRIFRGHWLGCYSNSAMLSMRK
jgi:hypothetical protein